MQTWHFPLVLFTTELDRRWRLTEPLLLGARAVLTPRRAPSDGTWPRRLRRLLRAADLATLYAVRRDVSPEVVTVALEQPPLPGQTVPSWAEPLPLRFAAALWPHDESLWHAYVPVLQLHAFAATRADLIDTLLPAEIRLALVRLDWLALPRLVFGQRATGLTVQTRSLAVKLPSPRQREQAERAAATRPNDSVLKAVTTDLVAAPGAPVYEQDDLLTRLADALTAQPYRSVLLVGPAGVGKTALVRELARRRDALLKPDDAPPPPLRTTGGARLVAGQSGYGMWQQRCRDLCRQAAHANAIIHLNGLLELMHVGKSTHNHFGIAGFLRPYLARGSLRGIAECTPEQIPLIEREDPHLLAAFARIDVPEPDEARSRRILAAVNAKPPQATGARLDPEALAVLDRLHRRYATYSAYPGRPLRFLSNLLADLREPRTIGPSEVRTAFGRETGLPRVLLDPDDRFDLDRTRTWFRERVIGQEEAVEAVVNLVATIKAGLTRPHRPLASLLFIGPTGVGKTELAKALTEFLFGQRDRLVRFDMSEYGDPVAVRRLVGTFGSEGLLTARVREQPFCVLLLDEFEKADASFFDLLLQMLGDGRLTDAAGRVADFRNAVVILTSNLGAESYRQGGFGFSGGLAAALGARLHFTQAVEQFLRPELFNRLDRLLPFAPLDAAALRRVADRELAAIAERDGILYRGTTLDVSQAAIERLATQGTDTRYGARPLKRALEREMLAPLAAQMNDYDPQLALAARVDATATATGIDIAVRARLDDAGRPIALTSQAAHSPALTLARESKQLRRRFQALRVTEAVRDLENELARVPAKRSEARRSRGDLLDAARRQRHEQVFDRVVAGLMAASEAETTARLALYDNRATPPAELATDLMAWRAELNQLARLLVALHEPAPNRHLLVMMASDPAALVRLGQGYAQLIRARGWQVEAVDYRLPSPTVQRATFPIWATAQYPDTHWQFHNDLAVLIRAESATDRLAVLERRVITDLTAWLDAPPESACGLALEVSGELAGVYLAGEGMMHVFVGQPELRCWVEDTSIRLHEIQPLPNLRGLNPATEPERRYNARRAVVLDPVLRELPWLGRDLGRLLGTIIDARFARRIEALWGADEAADIPF